MQRQIRALGLEDPLALDFVAHRSDKLDGSYLHCEKRLPDATATDVIWFDETRRDHVNVYLQSGSEKAYAPALERASDLINGFQSPLGMELLGTVDWLLSEAKVEPRVAPVRTALQN